jgi:two-component system sensor histidine kinase YesM
LFRRQSIFARFFLCFLAVWVPLNLLMVGILSYSGDQLAKNAVKTSDTHLSFLSYLLNRDFNKISQILYLISFDDEILEYSHQRSQPFSYQQYLLNVQIQQRMVSYSQASFLIEDLFLVFPDGGELSVRYTGSGLPEKVLENAWGASEQVDRLLIYEGKLVYLHKGVNGVLAGAKVNVRDILDTLHAFISQNAYQYLMRAVPSGDAIGMQAEDTEGAGLAELLRGKEEIPELLSVEGKRYVVRQIPLNIDQIQLIAYLPQDVLYQESNRIQFLFLLLNFAAVLVPVLMMIVFRRTIEYPLSQIVGALSQLEHGNYDYRLPQAGTVEFQYVFGAFGHLSQQLKNLIQEVLEKRLQIQEAQLRQLQAGINPHFLFNSLYIGYRMAKSGDTERTAQFCMYLGNYFKYTTYLNDDFMELSKEMEFVRNFLLLNQMRFPERLQFEITVEEGLEEWLVPNLMIQPLVENAIKHGVEKSLEPCTVILSAVREGRGIRISVEDDGGSVREEDLSEFYQKVSVSPSEERGYGLWNIQRRLKYLHAEGEGLRFEIPRPGHLRISFFLEEHAGKDEKQ